MPNALRRSPLLSPALLLNAYTRHRDVRLVDADLHQNKLLLAVALIRFRSVSHLENHCDIPVPIMAPYSTFQRRGLCSQRDGLDRFSASSR